MRSARNAEALQKDVADVAVSGTIDGSNPQRSASEFKRTNIARSDAEITALIEFRGEDIVARVDRGTAVKKRGRLGRPAVVGEIGKLRISVADVARAIEKSSGSGPGRAAGPVAAQIMSLGGDGTTVIGQICT